MRIIGIDPGMAITGYGIVEENNNGIKVVDYGCIKTDSGLQISERIKIIYNNLKDIILKFKPEKAVIEKLYFNKNVKTAITVGEARGAAILAAANFGIEVIEYTPLEVKQAVTGYGRADKKQIQQMVKIMLNLKSIPKPDDTADALAVAICHLNSYRLHKKIIKQL